MRGLEIQRVLSNLAYKVHHHMRGLEINQLAKQANTLVHHYMRGLESQICVATS